MNDYILITRSSNENELTGQIGIQKSKVVHWYYVNGELTIVLASSGSLGEYSYHISNDEYNSFLTQLTGLSAKDLQSDTNIQKEGWQEYKDSVL